MSQKGSHTWDIIIHYHCCPDCGCIIESREDFKYQLGKYIKDLECPFCQKQFTLIKSTKPQFGPLFGDSEVAEWDWSP